MRLDIGLERGTGGSRIGTWWVGLAMVALIALAGVTDIARGAQDLQRSIERAISNADLGDTQVGVSVIDLRTGRRLAEVNAYEALIPASNMKLLTSAAALLSLGEDFMFETRLIMDGDALVVVGSGDPGLGDPALLADLPEPMDVDAMLDFIVETIVSASGSSIREIVIDDRVFDREAVHPSWPAEQLQYYYCAEVGGLNFHLNMVNVFARPTSLNQPARVVIEPDASTIEVENITSTVASRTAAGRPQPSSIHIRRSEEGNRLTVSGRVSRSVGAPTSVRDTGLVFGQLLAERLEASGIEVGMAHEAATDAVRRPEDRERFDGRPILIIKTPMTEVLKRCNTDSYNLHAEALFKRLGHDLTSQPGSWALGAASLRSILIDHLGPGALEGLRVADGSGMSRQNAVSPNTLCALLVQMNTISDQDRRLAFRESLARSGEGTLSRNFVSPRQLRHDVIGKTGFLNGVRSFSGYIVPKGGGEPIATFSILMNGFTQSQSLRSRELRNELVRIIDRASVGLGSGAMVVQPDGP